MFREMAAWLWRRLPRRGRRLGVLLTNARFTVTAGAVVRDAQGRVLLFQHRFRPGSGWGIPGGFVQAREQPQDALRRELREEIGLEVTEPRLVFARTLHSYRQVELLFTCQQHGDAITRNVEIIRADWFALDALPAGLSHEQRQLLQFTIQAAENAKNAK